MAQTFDGIVTKYRDGTRNLVGRDCALSHHGVDFENQLIEFDANFERQGYAVRRKHLVATAGLVIRAFNDVKAHPAVAMHDELLWRWRHQLHQLAAACANAAWRDAPLTNERVVRDIEGEKARKRQLGHRFEKVKQEAKEAGETWQLFRTERNEFGWLAGLAFFKGGKPVLGQLAAIEPALRQAVQLLTRDDLKTRQIRAAFKRLSEVRDEIEKELDRLEALAEAFSATNLTRIAAWANGQHADQIRREAELHSRPVPFIADRYAAKGQTISYTAPDRPTVSATLSQVYEAPKPTLITVIKEATAAEFEPNSR